MVVGVERVRVLKMTRGSQAEQDWILKKNNFGCLGGYWAEQNRIDVAPRECVRPFY